jgi:hypothetical protein
MSERIGMTGLGPKIAAFGLKITRYPVTTVNDINLTSTDNFGIVLYYYINRKEVKTT